MSQKLNFINNWFISKMIPNNLSKDFIFLLVADIILSSILISVAKPFNYYFSC